MQSEWQRTEKNWKKCLVFSQIDPNNTRYKHLKPKAKIYYLCSYGHSDLALYFDFVDFTPRKVRLQLNYKNPKDISLFKIWGVSVQKVEKRDDVVVINEIEKKKKKKKLNFIIYNQK